MRIQLKDFQLFCDLLGTKRSEEKIVEAKMSYRTNNFKIAWPNKSVIQPHDNDGEVNEDASQNCDIVQPWTRELDVPKESEGTYLLHMKDLIAMFWFRIEDF